MKEKISPEKAFKNIEWSFKIKPEEIFDFFKNPPVQETDIEKKDLQPEKLLEMLCEEHSFSHERIDSVVEKLKEGKEKEKQSRLGRFLG